MADAMETRELLDIDVIEPARPDRSRNAS